MAFPSATRGAANMRQSSTAAPQPAGTKRAGPAVVGSAAGKAPKVEPAIIVYTTTEKDEIGIRTLVGDFVEKGSNHGRKVFRKVQTGGGQESVYLYFWDKRDGEEFSGWWFGNQVGGTQVWSRNSQLAQLPPKTGWTIPWDGPVKKDLHVVPASEKKLQEQNEAKMQQQKRAQELSLKAAVSSKESWEERVNKATEIVATVEVDTEQAIEDVQLALEGGEDSEIQKGTELLDKQAVALADAQRKIAIEGLAAQKNAPASLKAEMMSLGQRVRELQEMLKSEQTKIKNEALTRVQPMEDDEAEGETQTAVNPRELERENSHNKQLEEMLPVAMEKVDTAEDEVEKAAIAAAPLNIDTADDLRSVMLTAIKETEGRVRAAQAAIGEARRFISTKISQVQRFAPNAKKAALEEFQGLQARLTDAQNKLNPHKNIRQEYESRVQAKKLYEELSAKLAGAEIEVEKAGMMTAPLGGDSSDAIKETEATLSSAQSALSQTSRLLESKLKNAEKSGSSDAFGDLKGLQERCKLAQEKLDDVRKSLKETQIRVAADSLLKDVSEKVSSAEDELQKMAEVELPLLSGGKKGAELEALIKDADGVATQVHTAIAEAQTFVARKLVEVARFTEGPARAVREEIDMLQKRLEKGRERLTHFRSSMAERKRTHLLQDVEIKVTAAEAEVHKLTEAAAALNSVGAAGDTVSDSLTEALEQANACERAAQASIVVARKHLMQKTTELKTLALAGKGSGAELGKLQTRVNSMQHEIEKLRAKTKDTEEKIRVKQMLAEVAIRLQAAEADVDKVASSAVAPSEQVSPDQVQRMEKATTSAQTKLGATAKLVDVKLKSAEGFLKEELQGMRGRIAQAEAKLGTVIRASKEQKERLDASELVAQGLEKVEAAEAAVKVAGDTELPFLKGIEVLAAGEAQKAIAESEKAAGLAQKAVSDGRTFIVQKLADAKQFTSNASDSCTKELLALQKKLDASASRLSELKKDTAERKRKVQMQASGEKVTAVETAMEKLTAAMAKFGDDKLSEFSPEDARTACEDIAGAEQAAQSSVAEARKFLAARTQEAKALSEAQRTPCLAELSRLQSRLTQCQVELAKLSKQCTEREQKFVAQKLLREFEDGVKRLQTSQAALADITAPLLSPAAPTELIPGMRLDTLVEALQAYVRKSGISVDDLFSSIAGGNGKSNATVQSFLAFLEKLPELSGAESANFTEEQGKSLFTIACGEGKGLSLESLKALLRERRVCSLPTPAEESDGGEEITTIEAGEGVEVLETKNVDGILRARCVLARDGKTVWTTLENLDEANFRLSSSVAGRVASIEAVVSGVLARSVELAEYADQKMVEVSGVKQGPLAEVKTKLSQMRVKVSAEQASLEKLKKQVLAAKVAVNQKRKEELQSVSEVRCKAMAAAAIQESTAAIEAAEAKATKVVENAKAGSAEKLKTELSIKELEAIQRSSDEALKTLADAKAVLARCGDRFEAQKGPSRTHLLEPRVALTKLTSRASAAERKCKAATEAVRAALDDLLKEATKKAREALREAARKLGKSTDALFEQVSGGKGVISEEQFRKFVEKHGLPKDHVTLVFKAFGPYGMHKSGFSRALQEFCSCAAPIAITSDFDIGTSETIRKLEVHETFEVLEGPREDPETKVARVRGRALRDGREGWVTVKGNQGTPFLKPAQKPFIYVVGDGTLQEQAAANAAEVRKLHRDEVLELLEGPREEVPGAELFLTGTACTDGAQGWITLRGQDGVEAATIAKDTYVCRSAIAMTDGFDIKDCKVIRKVAVGEALVVIGGEGKKDAEVEITRLRFRAVKDNSEGWVTLKGNHGTLFVEASSSHYAVASASLQLREEKAIGAKTVRTLEKGEIFAGKEKPIEETAPARKVVRARAIDDSKAGWVCFGTAVPFQPWRPRYVCRQAVPLTTELNAKSSVARQATVGEFFEAVEGPTLDASSGLRRVRCAVAGTLVGWASIRGSDGDARLEVA